MLDFIKDRIALIIFLIAGDSISLIAFIKAPEIKSECTSLAAAISLLLMLLISLTIKYGLPTKTKKKRYIGVIIALTAICWIGFIWAYTNFSTINSRYGKIQYSKASSQAEAGDSTIVGGCAYTPEAQKEVDYYQKQHRTLTTIHLLSDFNMDTARVWSEEARDCARRAIILAFSLMIACLVAGITLTYELLAPAPKPKPKE